MLHLPYHAPLELHCQTHLFLSMCACGSCNRHVLAAAKPGARRQKGQTLAELEAAEGGPVKESQVGMAAVKRALQRKQQRGEKTGHAMVCKGACACVQAYQLGPTAGNSRNSSPASPPVPANVCPYCNTPALVRKLCLLVGPSQLVCPAAGITIL